MKKFYPLLLIAFLLLNVSCSKGDDNKVNEETNALAGEWQMEEFQYNGTTTVTQGDLMDQSFYLGTAKDIDVVLNFNESDNTWESSGSYMLELVTHVDGLTQLSNELYPNISGTGTYSLNGEILSLGYIQQAGALKIDEATVTKLTESELVLEFERLETSVISGFEVELLVEGFQKFSR